MTHNGKRINIFYEDLPASVRGISSEQENYYIVLINKNMPIRDQHQAIGHELAHIFLNHFNGVVLNRELEANKNAWRYYREYKAMRERGKSC